jgi:SWI/SNF-related matrix-associated actin-dependent regulator of chromatin subfamily A3
MSLYSSNSKTRSLLAFGSFDIVITTFETLVCDYKNYMSHELMLENLFSFSWHRIIVDEGEYLQDKLGKFANGFA